MQLIHEKGGLSGASGRVTGAFLLASILLFSLCGALGAAEREPGVGMIKNVSGEAFVLRDGRRIPASPGLELSRGDRLVTGSGGRMGILLKDDTALSLGPSTESSIQEYLYQPEEGRFAMVLRVARGVFGYLSGKIAKAAPGAVRIETPVATLGVRGTYFVARIVP